MDRASSSYDKRTQVLERGLIDQVIDFVARHNPMEAWLEGGVRQEKRA